MGDDLGLVGISHRKHTQDTIAGYVIPPDAKGDERLRALHHACDFAESMYLATCNRVELLFVCKPGVSVETYRQRVLQFFEQHHAHRHLFAYEGEGAVERWMLVAASLDSMQLGDAQILGQCKQALDRAQSLGLAGKRLQRVCDAAFASAKHIRSHTDVGRYAVSVMSLVEHELQSHVASLLHRAQPPRIAIVGVGEMTQQALRALQPYGEHLHIIFVNRTLSKAQELAYMHHADAIALHDFIENPPPCDVLITSTASPHILFDALFFQKLSLSPMVIDLGLPRDVDPDVVHACGVVLHDLDSMHRASECNRHARQEQYAQARLMIDDALEQYAQRERAVRASDGIVALHDAYHNVLQESLDALPQHALAPGGDMIVAQWAQRLVNRLLHTPTVGLKRLARDHGTSAVDAFQGVKRDT